MQAVMISQVSNDMRFSDAFMLFTRLSLLITRRRPEIAVHCILIHVLPHIADVKVSDINRFMVNQLVNPLILDGKIVMGRRVFSLMKQFLSWCAFQGMIDVSPLNDMSLNKVAGGAKPTSRAEADRRRGMGVLEYMGLLQCVCWYKMGGQAMSCIRKTT